MATTRNKNTTPKKSAKTSTPAPTRTHTPNRKVRTSPSAIMPEIEITPFANPDSFTLAFVSLVFGQFKVKDLYIRLFEDADCGEIAVLCYPAKKGKDGKYYSSCNPITKEFRKELNDAVIEKYIEMTGDNVAY